MLGGGGVLGLLSVRPHFCWGGVGAAKGLLPYFLVPKGNQPTACTLALWWLKFGPTGILLLGPTAFLWQFGCCCHGGLGGRCVVLLGGVISVRFWLSRRPLTRFKSFLFEFVRIVLPLELEIRFV